MALKTCWVSHEGLEVTFQNASLKETDRGCFCSKVGFIQFGVSRGLQLRLSAVVATGKSPLAREGSAFRAAPGGVGCVNGAWLSPAGGKGTRLSPEGLRSASGELGPR